jgi:hypothetical protein
MPKSWKTFIVFSTSTVISPMKLFRRYFTEGWNKITPNIIANLQRNYFVGTLQWIIFFWRAFSIYKTFGFFFFLMEMPTKKKLLTSGLPMKVFCP